MKTRHQTKIPTHWGCPFFRSFLKDLQNKPPKKCGPQTKSRQRALERPSKGWLVHRWILFGSSQPTPRPRRWQQGHRRWASSYFVYVRSRQRRVAGMLGFFWSNKWFRCETPGFFRGVLKPRLFEGVKTWFGVVELPGFLPHIFWTRCCWVGFVLCSGMQYSIVKRSTVKSTRKDRQFGQKQWPRMARKVPRTSGGLEPGICYEYSGRENVGQSWHPAVLEIKRKAWWLGWAGRGGRARVGESSWVGVGVLEKTEA